MPAKALLDTDTLSALLRGTPAAVMRARGYLAEHRAFSLSIITRYEILRGLMAKDAVAQVEAFHRFCEACLVLPLTDDIAVRGAGISAALRKRGQPTGDADVLIAASALVHGYGVVTNNESHFRRIDGLYVDNWLRG